MRVLDFEFELSERFQVQSTASSEEGICIDIVGENAQSLLEAVVQQAITVGFSSSKREVDRVELERGEQRVVLAFDSTGLTIQVYDPTGLPLARHDGSAILLGDLRVDCGARVITPLRERYLEQHQLRRAAWRVSGVSAADAVTRVIDEAVVSKRLTRGPVLGPPKGGGEVWVGEAYSDVELVKARATTEGESVLLEVDLVDKRLCARVTTTG